jgi:hypothetical protein
MKSTPGITSSSIKDSERHMIYGNIFIIIDEITNQCHKLSFYVDTRM